MTTFKRKYEWLILIFIAVLISPKIVDALFDVHLGEFTTLYHLKASDVLNYIGAVMNGGCALIAVVVAVQHFKSNNKPIIVPKNKVTFYYDTASGKFLFPDPNAENNNPDYVDFLELTNITNATAIDFSIRFTTNRGANFYEIINKIGGNVECLSSSYEDLIIKNCGVFNGISTLRMQFPTDLDFIIRTICIRKYEFANSDKRYGERNNHFVNREYKIAELEIETENIYHKALQKELLRYDIYLKITHIFNVKAKDRIDIIFKKAF